MSMIMTVSKLISIFKQYAGNKKDAVASKLQESKHVDKTLRANSVRCKQAQYMKVCYFK